MNSIDLEWKSALLRNDSSILEAINNLNYTSLQIVLVINSEKRLVGTVTDGDIRRGLLNGANLNQSVSEIMNKSPLIVTPELDRDSVLSIMRANRIFHIPVVDKNQVIIDLHKFENIYAEKNYENLVVIMAGGEGKRLRPYTENCPKPMLPVAGKPILEHIIMRGVFEGFSNFILSINYLGAIIENYFEDGKRWNIDIKYIKEDIPLGTIGSISLLDPTPSLPIIITNGDILTDICFDKLLDFHCRQNATATMAVRSYEWQNPFGVVQTDGIDIVGLTEKPVHRSYVNAGIYVLNPSALHLLNKSEFCDMPTLLEKLLHNEERVIAYPMHEPWLDVGRPDDLALASNFHKKIR